MIRPRLFITAKQNAVNIKYNTHYTIKHSIIREPSIVDEFYKEHAEPSDDKNPSVSMVDPLYILFNQERLDNLGQMGAKAFIDGLQKRSSSLEELRKQCSDDDLMCMIKSRHLQSPAEIVAWCRYMQSNIDTFNSEVKKIVDARTAEMEAKKAEASANVEPLKTE